MKRWTRALALGVTSTLLGCSSGGGSRAGSATTRTTMLPVSAGALVSQRALDAVAIGYERSCRSPGAVVAVRARGGAERFARAGDFASDVPLSTDSDFFAGSVTKLFVATLAFQLVAAHELALTSRVSTYLPTWPDGRRITVAMLLDHTSGMGDFANDFSPQLRTLVLDDLRRVYGYDEVLALVRAVPRVAAPGATYHYSNANYIVLGAIERRVLGRSLGAAMERRIITPLHLSHTFYAPDDLARLAKVEFHGLFDVFGNGDPIDIAGFPRSAAFTVDPAGSGLVTNASDLLTFLHELYDTSTLVARGDARQLADSVSTVHERDLLLGGGHTISGHGGASPGAQVLAVHDFRTDDDVVVWCNRLDPGAEELLPSVVAVRRLVVALRSLDARRR